MSRTQDVQNDLVEKFVSSFTTLDDMSARKELFPIAWELRSGEKNELDWPLWKPIQVDTGRSHLEPLYSKLPCRFPPLFETLLLKYRWAEVEIGSCTLLANPPGPDLSRFLEQISTAPAFWTALLSAGYVQFARAAGGHFDPVCFAVKSRNKSQDCPVVN